MSVHTIHAHIDMQLTAEQEVRVEACDKARYALRFLIDHPDILLKMDCLEKWEHDIYKETFNTILGPELVAKRVQFTWVNFGGRGAENATTNNITQKSISEGE